MRPIDNPVRHGSASWASTCVSWVCIMRPHTRPCATLGRTLAHGITHKAKPHAPCYERVGQHLGARWATTHTPRAHGLAPALCERKTACAGLCVGVQVRDCQPRMWVRDMASWARMGVHTCVIDNPASGCAREAPARAGAN